MKITFLGTAAATAMPLPFCNCDVCVEARALRGRDIRKRASIVINDEILVDMGPDSINACYEYGVSLSGIKCILQTHAHSDHFDAGHMMTRHIDYAGRDLNPITLVSSQGVMRAMDRMLRREDSEANLFDGEFQQKLKLSLLPVRPLEQIAIGDYSICAFDSLHDMTQGAIIYLVSDKSGSVLYGADLLRISDEVYRRLANSALGAVILDQTYGDGFNAGGHMDAGQVIEAISELKRLNAITPATQIYATHISHEGNGTHAAMQALSKPHGYDIAYDGLTITLPPTSPN